MAHRPHACAPPEAERDALRALLRVGLHWDVEVTDAPGPRPAGIAGLLLGAPGELHTHPAAGGSRLPGWSSRPPTKPRCSRACCTPRRGSNVVLLTSLGGGAFGNESAVDPRCHPAALQLAGDCTWMCASSVTARRRRPGAAGE